MKKLLTYILLTLLVAVPIFSQFARPAAAQDEKRIEIMSPWGGEEEQALLKVLAAFEAQSGIKVDHTGTRDVASVIARAEAGNPPDFYISPLPAVVWEFARDGYLVPLDSFLDMAAVEAAFAPDWLGLGSYEGHLYGIWGEVAPKSLVWYDAELFADKGYAIPANWDEMLALADQIAADGLTPWSIAQESGDATGWVGTSEYWEAAESRLHELIEREKRKPCLPTPEISPWVRLQSRIAHLPLLAVEGWSLAWARLLTARA